MRADRLVSALLLLQSRGQLTAAEIADELKISVATARRDLEALSNAGVPVYPQAGRGGGWHLVGGARTDLSGLTAPEAQALFLLMGPAASAAPALKSALRKLVRALPGTFRADAEAAADAVVVDPTRWGDAERERPELVDVLQAAVVRRRQVELTYGGRGREPSVRAVNPLGLVDKDDVWYLIADTERGRRTYRVDRIVDAAVTDQNFDRPGDFNLGETWERVVNDMEKGRSLVWASVLIPQKFARILRDHFGRHFEEVGTMDDGRSRVRVAAPMALSIAEQLAGWGAIVEVEGPEAVRNELARIGAELTALYS